MREKRALDFRSLYRATGLVVLGTALPAGATNLLTNPGFESPPDPGAQTDSTVTGWNLIFDCQRSTFHASPPANQYNIWAKTFESLGGGVTQNFSNGFTIGATYNLSSQIFFESAYPTTSAQILVGLDWMDAGGNLVGTPAVNTINPTDASVANAIASGTFTTFSISGVAPAGATQVQVSLGWAGGGTVPGAQSVFFDNADLEGPGTPPSSASWIVDGSGDWNIGGNWASGSSPNAVGAEADLTDAITSSRTVFTDVAITLGTLTFNNAHTYEITGVGSLTLQATTGSAQVNVQQGVQEINLPTTIASNTIFNVTSGATLVVADPITINSGKTITQTGGGTVNYESIINVLGSAGIAFGNSTHAHQLNISATGTASIGGTGSVLNVDSLSNAGALDVKKNAMVISYGTGADPSSSVLQQLTTGYHNGAWNGTGINTSSSITGQTAVGWKDDTTGKAITVKYTTYGDSNLDGVVSTADFTTMAADFNKTGQVWAGGDFNYDGKVNALDFNALASNFGRPLADVTLGSVVPEPMSGAVLMLAGILASTRRRRLS